MKAFEAMRVAAAEIEKLRKENEDLKKKLAEASWVTNPDRMGGQFTDEEKNRSNW